MSNSQPMQNAILSQYRTTGNLDARLRLHRDYSTNPQGWFDWYLDQLDLAPGSRILEIGCGPAALWKDQPARMDPSWQLVLSDFSPGMVRAARQNTLAHLRYANLDAQALPFPSGYFDAVLANHMLYHVPDQPRAAAEIRRVLKAGGCLYAATNGETHMTGLDELIERLAPALAPSRDQEVTRWRTSFTLENGTDLLRRSFDEVRIIRYLDDLRITAARPVVDYTLSMVANSAQELPGETITAFEAALEQELAQHGCIFIHKDAGMFIAR